jgi:pyruvate/2-oxoglutarate dehydrogenase complex dihydrolipoamide dehydrogenase (E3) component
MAAERSYDAIVVGAGQGGKPLSMVLAKAGLKTAVVEESGQMESVRVCLFDGTGR